MVFLRYVYISGLTLWLGGMITLGAVAAPVAFAVLQSQQPTGGRALAGAVFGEMLRRFNYVTYGCGAAMLIALAGMALLGPRPLSFAIRSGIVAAMLIVSLYSGIWVTGQIERLQASIDTPVSSLANDDPRRARFGRLHGLSTVLMMINVGGCLVLLGWEAME